MSDSNDDLHPPPSKPSSRPVGGTEYSWCKAVPTGTGTTVLALLLTAPPEPSLLRAALHALQNSRPVLRSRLRFDANANSFSFVTAPAPYLEVATFDLPSTSQILENSADSGALDMITRFHLLHEHEMSRNSWLDPELWDDGGVDVFHASQYALSETQWAVVLRLHTGACDRTTAAVMLRDLKRLVGGGEPGTKEAAREEGLSPTIEELIPKGKADKPFWARGVNMLGYSLNSLRMSNLTFEEAAPPRVTQMVRLKMNSADTDRLLAGCKSRGIKLCGALAAAALMAGHSSRNLPENTWQKYGVVTLVDCRSLLDPPLPSHSPGFYHSAILNSHDICGNETLWELAKRTYTSFSDAKASNKHFSDMGDLNFLMCKAIDNPGLTPSGSLRTAILSVFEESIIEVSDSEMEKVIGLEDYLGCASVNGVGPSMALFDTIRDGCLDCACPYPAPLHSREQMQRLIDEMKRILIEAD